MGLFDLYEKQADTAAPNPLQALPRTAGERFGAEFDATQAPDRYWNSVSARRDMWQKSADQLFEQTGQKFENPENPPTPAELAAQAGTPSQPLAVQAARRQAIIDAHRTNFADRDPDMIDPERIDQYIAEESIRRREKAASYVGTGNGLAGFFGGAVGETLTPHGAVGLLIPVTRLPGAAASVIGQTFLGNVARETLFQAGANVAVQAGAEALDFASRREFGTEQTAGEVAENLAGAGVIGGLIGGGARALHLKWLGLPEKVRLNAPTEVKDAFRVLEAQALYSGMNRLGIDPLLHERYQDRALDAIMRGQPVTLPDLARTADTPLTALGTILRSAPDEIKANISGLSTALDRIKALPDTEIETVARELKPNSFVQTDRLAREIQTARAELAAMRSNVEGITLSDIADPLTATRLRDIEDRLGEKGLRRAERNQLERERDQITESIDPKGEMAKDLERARREVETEAETKRRTNLEKKVEALEKEQAIARAEADREVAFLRGKLDNLGGSMLSKFGDEVPADVLAREFGAGTASDLEGAIGRADALRQARVLRGTGLNPIHPLTAEQRAQQVLVVAKAKLAEARKVVPERAEKSTPERRKALAVVHGLERAVEKLEGKSRANVEKTKYLLGPAYDFDSLVSSEMERLGKSYGAAQPKAGQLREDARLSAFRKETRTEIDAALERGGIDKDSADDLFEFYDRKANESTEQALDRAIDKWTEARTSAQMRGIEDSVSWNRDMDFLHNALESESFMPSPGGEFGPGLKGKEVMLPASPGFLRPAKSGGLSIEDTFSPEQLKTLQHEASQVVLSRPTMEVEFNGRTMSAIEAMNEADQMAKDAAAAAACAMGAPI